MTASPTVTEPSPAPETAPEKPRKMLSSDQSFWSIAWRQFKKDRTNVAGLVTVVLLVGLAIFAPFIANGRPYKIRGVLTNFYATDVAAFRDWSGIYRRNADLLADASSRLSPSERVDLEGDTQLYREGMPKILGRLESYLRPDDAKALGELEGKFVKLLAVEPAKLDRDDYDALGREIDERFGALAFEPAYKRVAGPLASFEYGTEGLCVKRVMKVLQDLRDARLDEDKKAIAKNEAALKELAPSFEALAKQVETGVQALGSFFGGADAADLAKIAPELAGLIRAFAQERADEKADETHKATFSALSSRVDAISRKPIDPEKQRLPRTTLYPVIGYLRPLEIGFMVLYVTGILAFVFGGAFKKLTERLPLDPSDLGSVRLGLLLAPALLSGVVWMLAVPDRESPSDSYYKQFEEELAAHPDGDSAISFPPVPYGENENIQQDKVKPPTWLESTESLVERLRSTSHDPLPAGTTEEELKLYLDAPGGKTIHADFTFYDAESEKTLGMAPAASPSERIGLTVDAKGTITGVAPTGSAAAAGLAKGDRLTGSLDEVLAATPVTALVKKRSGLTLMGRNVTLAAWRPPTKPEVFGPWADALVKKRLTPYRSHLLGTDRGGRDVLARLVIGSRISLSVGFVAVGINLLIGVVLGALAGYFRGGVDMAISRWTEIVMCFPSFFLILAVNVILPPSIWNVMFAIGLIGWTAEMRLVRGEFLRLVNLDFVVAGRALGLSNARVIFRHVLPNAMAPVLVAATFGIAGAILTESSLSFLGFGVPPPQASWGAVLNEAFGAEKEMWWVTIFPGIMIFLTITAYNLVGEGFRDATDPRLRK